MLTRRPRPGHSAGIRSSEITPESMFLTRRDALRGALAAAGAVGLGVAWPSSAAVPTPTPLKFTRNKQYSTMETPNSYEDITGYNNFYEFGTDKEDPAANSGGFKPAPWSVKIAGEAEVTGELPLEEVLAGLPLEERVYRLRCVEAWSMVIP